MTEERGIMTDKKRKIPAISEIVFDMAYLIFVVLAGSWLLIQAEGDRLVVLYGAMTLLLGFGDAFHLLPRICSLWTDSMDSHVKSLGFGKLVTSVSMTVFYVMLYEIWQMLYQKELPAGLTAVVIFLAGARIVLCLLPQNGWFSRTPSFRFSIYRNVPFLILGVIVAMLYAFGSGGVYVLGFRYMAVLILFSFAFYLLVVLGSERNKKMGMFMIPKTCMYIWMICLGFYLL